MLLTHICRAVTVSGFSCCTLGVALVGTESCSHLQHQLRPQSAYVLYRCWSERSRASQCAGDGDESAVGKTEAQNGAKWKQRHYPAQPQRLSWEPLHPIPGYKPTVFVSCGLPAQDKPRNPNVVELPESFMSSETTMASQRVWRGAAPRRAPAPTPRQGLYPCISALPQDYRTSRVCIASSNI